MWTGWLLSAWAGPANLEVRREFIFDELGRSGDVGYMPNRLMLHDGGLTMLVGAERQRGRAWIEVHVDPSRVTPPT